MLVLFSCIVSIDVSQIIARRSLIVSGHFVI